MMRHAAAALVTFRRVEDAVTVHSEFAAHPFVVNAQQAVVVFATPALSQFAPHSFAYSNSFTHPYS